MSRGLVSKEARKRKKKLPYFKEGGSREKRKTNGDCGLYNLITHGNLLRQDRFLCNAGFVLCGPSYLADVCWFHSWQDVLVSWTWLGDCGIGVDLYSLVGPKQWGWLEWLGSQYLKFSPVCPFVRSSLSALGSKNRFEYPKIRPLLRGIIAKDATLEVFRRLNIGLFRLLRIQKLLLRVGLHGLCHSSPIGDYR